MSSNLVVSPISDGHHPFQPIPISYNHHHHHDPTTTTIDHLINTILTDATTPNITLDTQQWTTGKGLTYAIDIGFLVFCCFMSILIPLLYYIIILRRKDRFTLYSSSPSLTTSGGMKQATQQCACSKTSWKNFLLSLPLGPYNTLAFINDLEGLALFQSTWFHVIIFRLLCMSSKRSLDVDNAFDVGNSSSLIVVDSPLLEKKKRLYNISMWISTFYVLFVRICCVALGVTSAAYVGISEVNNGQTWITYTQYLTNNSFNVFIVFCAFVTLTHIVYICIVFGYSFKKSRDGTLNVFPYLDTAPKPFVTAMKIYANCLWILITLNLVTSNVVR